MTALNIEIRTKSDFLTGEPPIFIPDQSILQRHFRHVCTLLFLSQAVFGVNAPAHDFNSARHLQKAGPNISKKTHLDTNHSSGQTWIPGGDVFYHIRQANTPGILSASHFC